MIVSLLPLRLLDFVDFFFSFGSFFLNTDIVHSDFLSFFQMMAVLSLSCVIVLKTGVSPLMNFLIGHCKSVVTEKAEIYNSRLEVLSTNQSLIDIKEYHKPIDIEQLKKDTVSSLHFELDFETQVFSDKCIVTFFYCLIFLVIAPLIDNYTLLNFFLLCLTFLLFIYLLLLRRCSKSLKKNGKVFIMSKLKINKHRPFNMFRISMIHIAIFAALSFFACFFAKDIHSVFTLNVFFLLYIALSIWCFISQYYLMTITVPRALLKIHDCNMQSLNETANLLEKLVSQKNKNKTITT